MYQAVKGMLPKTKTREDLIKKKLHLYPGPYHKYHSVGLPQFTDPIPSDINAELGFNDLDPANNKIIFATGEIPEEYKDIPVEIDQSISEPYYLTK